MKLSQTLNIFLILIIFSSCSNKIFLQRKYTKGHFFAKHGSVNSPKSQSSVKTVSTKDDKVTEQVISSIQKKEKESGEEIIITSKVTESVSNTKRVIDNRSKSLQFHAEGGHEIVKHKTQINKAHKKAEGVNGILSLAFVFISAFCLFLPITIVFGGAASVGTGIILLSMLLSVIAVWAASKSIKFCFDAFATDGFFSKLLGFYSIFSAFQELILGAVLLVLLLLLLL